MLNEKRIKSIIIISLLLIEIFVWTVNGSGNSWSLGIIGGADGPTTIIVGDGDDKPGDENDEPDKAGNDESGGGAPSDSGDADQNSEKDAALMEAEEKRTADPDQQGASPRQGLQTG